MRNGSTKYRSQLKRYLRGGYMLTNIFLVSNARNNHCKLFDTKHIKVTFRWLPMCHNDICVNYSVNKNAVRHTAGTIVS